MNILWDYDGTLIDSYPVFTKILTEILGQPTVEQEILSHLKISFSHAIQHYRLTAYQIKEIFDREDLLHPSQTRPFPQVEEVLRKANTNVIMTHNSREIVARTLAYHGLEHYFQEIVSSDNGFPKKPDPASYAYLHRKYKLDLAIGDREIDILPAKAIGIKTCLFQNSAPGADYYLMNYKDFHHIL